MKTIQKLRILLLLVSMTASVVLCCGCGLRFGGADSGETSSAVSSDTVGTLADGVMGPHIYAEYSDDIMIDKAREKAKAYEGVETAFAFPLKKQYDSREAILQEKYDLIECCRAYTTGKDPDDPRVQAANKLEDELHDRLEALWKKEYPLTKQEKKQIKVNYFYETVFVRWSTVQDCVRVRDEQSSLNEMVESNYLQSTSRYEEILELKKRYEAGELSIDRALKQVVPDFELDATYLYSDVIMQHLDLA